MDHITRKLVQTILEITQPLSDMPWETPSSENFSPHPYEIYDYTKIAGRQKNNLEQAAASIHDAWMSRNPKADWNAAQHVPYSDLPEEKQQKEEETTEDGDYAGAPEHGGMTQPELELYYQQYMRDQRKPILQKKPAKELENPEIAKMMGGSD